MLRTPPRNRRSDLLVVIPVLAILFPFGYTAVSGVVTRNTAGPEPFLLKPDPSHGPCVRDATYMRFHHWELLKSTRDEVVRSGKRGSITLKKCTECHTSREQFCDRCHNAASVTPDCWGCHTFP